MRVFSNGSTASLQPPKVHCGLGCWQQRRYDFQLVPNHATKSLLYCRAGQKDARQLTHRGLVAAADGSVDLRANTKVLVLWLLMRADIQI